MQMLRRCLRRPITIFGIILAAVLLVLAPNGQRPIAILSDLRDLRAYSPAPTRAGKVGSGMYGDPGWLAVDRNIEPAHRRARWVPLAKLAMMDEAGLTGLERALQLDDGYELLDQYFTTLGPHNETDGFVNNPAFAYLRDKTVLLIGDSQDRDFLDFACSSLQGSWTLRNFWWRGDGKHSLSEEVGLKYRTFALHHCQLPTAFGNTSIWSTPTYGSITDERTFDKMFQDRPEKTYDIRVQRLGEAFQAEGINVDLIITHTILWDLSAANVIEANALRPPSSSLRVKDMHRFRERLEQNLPILNRAFPHTSKMYRMLHDVRVKEGDWFYRYANDGVTKTPRTPYMNNKIAQLNAVVRDVIPAHGVMPFELGHVLSGYLQDHRDDQHFGKIGQGLYLQMLLYHIRQLS